MTTIDNYDTTTNLTAATNSTTSCFDSSCVLFFRHALQSIPLTYSPPSSSSCSVATAVDPSTIIQATAADTQTNTNNNNYNTNTQGKSANTDNKTTTITKTCTADTRTDSKICSIRSTAYISALQQPAATVDNSTDNTADNTNNLTDLRYLQQSRFAKYLPTHRNTASATSINKDYRNMSMDELMGSCLDMTTRLEQSRGSIINNTSNTHATTIHTTTATTTTSNSNNNTTSTTTPTPSEIMIAAMKFMSSPITTANTDFLTESCHLSTNTNNNANTNRNKNNNDFNQTHSSSSRYDLYYAMLYYVLYYSSVYEYYYDSNY